jgi:hypothetical protein
MKRILLLIGAFSFVPESVTGSIYAITKGMDTVASHSIATNYPNRQLKRPTLLKRQGLF